MNRIQIIIVIVILSAFAGGSSGETPVSGASPDEVSQNSTVIGDGHLIWAKRAGGKFGDNGDGITRLSDDSTVVTGNFGGSATFGEGEANETVLVSAGGSNMFVARYNPGGTLAWVKHAGGTIFELVNGITTLSDDSTVVTGFFGDYVDAATFGEGETNETVLIIAGWCIFIARYNHDGTLEWVKRTTTTESVNYQEITTLSDDSTVVIGNFHGSVTFGEGEANETVLVSDDSDNIYVARYNPDGTLAWVKQAGGKFLNYSYVNGITTLSDDSIVVTGDYRESATFGKGEENETVLISDGWYDIFIARYNHDGTLAWVKRTPGTDFITYQEITTLSDDSTVVIGRLKGSATFGEGEPNETVLVSDDSDNTFVAQYNPDGTLGWVKHAGGPSIYAGMGITTLSDDSKVVTGVFTGTAIFGRGETNEIILVSDGENGMFLARYNPDGTLAWANSMGGTVSHFSTGSGIIALSDDSTVVTGLFMGSATFGAGESNETVLVSDGDADIFVARYAP